MCIIIRPVKEINKKKKKNTLVIPNTTLILSYSQKVIDCQPFFSPVCEKTCIFVLCASPDLREIVFILQSQSNSFHVRQAERRRVDLLKQAHGLAEVRLHHVDL